MKSIADYTSEFTGINTNHYSIKPAVIDLLKFREMLERTVVKRKRDSINSLINIADELISIESAKVLEKKRHN